MKVLLVRRVLVAGVAGVLVVSGSLVFAGSAAAAVPVCAGPSCTQTFDYTGGLQSFVVPAGVTALQVTVSGAEGGMGPNISSPGGTGGTTIGGVQVAGGEQFRVLVGGTGSDFSSGAAYGGGAPSGVGSVDGGGGGGSFLFDSTGALVLAGGGGGGGGTFNGVTPDPGGDGAGAGQTGGTGSTVGLYGSSEVGATGGSQTGPGQGGRNVVGDGFDGSGPAGNLQPGSGGDGYSYDVNGIRDGGAGGGGGYYGGGGGAYASAGGGGSGYAAAGGVSVVGATVGGRVGDGVVVISWQRSPAELTLSQSRSRTVLGTPVQLTATVTGSVGGPTGTVTFSDGGTALPGCSEVPVAGGSAGCTTSSLPVGTSTVLASYSGDVSYAPATSDLPHQVNPVLTVRTTQLPEATAGAVEDVTLVASGGFAPYRWAVTGGALPPGLTLNANGRISGTPTMAGSYEFTATVTDSDAPQGTADRTYSLEVNRTAPRPVFTDAAPSDAVTAGTYQARVTSDSPGAITYSVTGRVCTTTRSGLVTFQHAGSCVVTARQAAAAEYLPGAVSRTITVARAAQRVTITNAERADAVVGDHHLVTATGGKSGLPVVLAATGGCILSPAGILTFTAAGNCTVTATQAGDDDYLSGADSQSISVAPFTASTATSPTTTSSITTSASQVLPTSAGPAATDVLADTGVDVGRGLIVGLVALVAGGCLLLITRRRPAQPITHRPASRPDRTH